MHSTHAQKNVSRAAPAGRGAGIPRVPRTGTGSCRPIKGAKRASTLRNYTVVPAKIVTVQDQRAMAKLPEACCRHPGSRIGHGLLATAFLLVVLGCIISLSVFAVKHDEIQANLPDESDGDCILYVSRSRVVNDDIGDGGFCRFAIYGSVVVGLGAALYLIVFVIKLLIGVSL